MNTRRRRGLSVILLFMWLCPLYADEGVSIKQDEPPFRVGVETWISTGESRWEISFKEVIPSLGVLNGRSRLEWEELDAFVHRFHAEYRFTSWFRLFAAYGFGRINDGQNTDTDWFTLEEYGDFMLAQSIAETSGDITMLDIDAYFRLNEMFKRRTLRGEWDLVAGFRYYEEDLRDRRGVMTVLLEKPVREPFAGLNSTYRFEWSAFRLGLRGRVPMTERVSAHAELAGLFGVRFEGAGFWNLRTDFRSQSPNFEQDAVAGTGAEFKAALAYEFTPAFFGELGYRAFWMKARNGTDRTYFADGTTGVANLDSVETMRHGVFFGLGGRF